MADISFIGLGVMGFPMASHLAKAGHKVTVYNRTPAKAQAWLEQHKDYSVAMASTPAEAARDKDFVMSCVSKDEDLFEVTLGAQAAFHTMKKGAVFIDHTTASADAARKLASEAQRRGFNFMDAPVSGGQSGAENGILSIMCGAEKSIFERCLPVMSAYGKSIQLIGDIGCGQLTKMANQLCVLGLIQSLAEGLTFAKAAGLDTEKVFAAVSQGASRSWQMENRWKTMAENKFDLGFAVNLMRKDIGIALDEAKKLEVTLPVAKQIDSFYEELQKMGDGDLDTSSLIKLLKKC